MTLRASPNGHYQKGRSKGVRMSSGGDDARGPLGTLLEEDEALASSQGTEAPCEVFSPLF